MMFMMFVMSELKFRAQNLSRPMRNKISHHRVVYDEKNSTGKTPIVIQKKILWVYCFTNSRFFYMVNGIYIFGFIGFKINS